MSDDPACFSFYAGSSHPSCGSCLASRRCKAVLVSDGFDILGAVVNQMIVELPAGHYRDTDRIKEIVKQIQDPPIISLSRDEEELLGLVGSDKELEDLNI